MKKKLTHPILLLLFCLTSTMFAQEIQWASSGENHFIFDDHEVLSPINKSSSATTVQTVSTFVLNHWLELSNFKLFSKKFGGNLQGLPINKSSKPIGSSPEFFYFPASYQVGIYFVHKDQFCEGIPPTGKDNLPLVIEDQKEPGYLNNTPFAFDAGLVLDNRTCMDFEQTKSGLKPNIESLKTTATMIGFKSAKEERSFRDEIIDFDPEKSIRLERNGNGVHFKYREETIFSTEIEKINEYRVVIAIYSPLSQGTQLLKQSISIKESACLTVDQLFGISPNSKSVPIVNEYSWLALGSNEIYEEYMGDLWNDFNYSFDHKFSNGYDLSLSSYCKCKDIGDKNENYSTACSYDIKGNLKGQAVGYYDDLGQATQNQSLNVKTGNLWLNQILNDSKGRAAFKSLDAPTTGNPRLLRNYNFIKDNNNNNFNNSDFETGDILNPGTVASTPNTLGWYYSNQNTDQPQQDITDRPYTRTIFSDLFPGQISRLIGGNKRDGQWRQIYAFSMPAGQELAQSVAFGESKYNTIETIKTISRDVHGVENVIFTDTEGKTLGAARSGGSSYRNMFVSIKKQGFVDIHVPENTTGFSITKPSNIQIEIFDLLSEESITTPTTSLPKGFYRVSIINMESFNPQTMTVRVNYKENYYDYALNEYDKIGRLIASYQPVGTTKATKPKTIYSYNGLGELIYAKSMDEGKVWFKYRKDGQVRFSLNSKQLSNNEFSYTNYDDRGRPIESGVALGEFDNLDADNSLITGEKEMNFTTYDYLESADLSFLSSIHPTYANPSFLAGNVAKTQSKEDADNITSTTYYSYDVRGRVQWIVQNIAGLGEPKTIDYEYDPVTGQILKIIYQKFTSSELFVHRYTYDEINQELVKVETSTDNNNFIEHAEYSYYDNKSLKRIELGDGIQGLDYVYNLRGQLKAINHPNLTASSDPGGDNNDLFGMVIDYHTDDYSRNSNFNLISSGQNRFNGNIKGISWRTNGLSNSALSQYQFQYNRNNWLEQADFTGGNAVTSSDYQVRIPQYDANGNIERLIRNKNKESIPNGNKMDDLYYTYRTDIPNRLSHIDDDVSGTTNADDIKDQPNNNYKYNEIGQLEENILEGITYEYNTIGLVTSIRENGVLKVSFTYDDKGYRMKKTSYSASLPPVHTYYVRDVFGNVMSIYRNTVQKELPIYGINRLGIFYKDSNVSAYQLTDHLGNVRAVVSKDTNGNAAALVHASDYYPFGMPMPNRQLVNGEPYRYGYQGEFAETDPETGKPAFQLRLWDSRIGRWLTVDPYKQFNSPYLGMGNNPVNFVDPDGGCIRNGEICDEEIGKVIGFAYDENDILWNWKDGAWELPTRQPLDEIILHADARPGSELQLLYYRQWKSIEYDFYKARGEMGRGALTIALAPVAVIIGIEAAPIIAAYSASALPTIAANAPRVISAARTAFTVSTNGWRLKLGYELASEAVVNGTNFGDYNLLGIASGTLFPNFGGTIIGSFEVSYNMKREDITWNNYVINLSAGFLKNKVHSNIDAWSQELGGKGAIKGFEHIFTVGSSSTIDLFSKNFKDQFKEEK